MYLSTDLPDSTPFVISPPLYKIGMGNIEINRQIKRKLKWVSGNRSGPFTTLIRSTEYCLGDELSASRREHFNSITSTNLSGKPEREFIMAGNHRYRSFRYHNLDLRSKKGALNQGCQGLAFSHWSLKRSFAHPSASGSWPERIT